MNQLAFTAFSLNGVDAQKFLQGQVTVHVERLVENESRYTAICDLKGRIHFGLWIKKINSESFELVTTQDQAEEFAKHIRKFGAFSKMKLEEISSVFPTINGIQTDFSTTEIDINTWQVQAIQSGQAWITQTTEHLFQPQELRLHQREGVHFDKGCYLGQEIVARLWFKAKPKHWLHLIQGKETTPAPATQLNKDVEVVNSIAFDNGYLALVIAKPTALQELDVKVLDLPEALNGDVARPS
ncbi:CAF17-like 4Fe-4S cluster assembly/insertion protein YgfZ [Acinetobacter haemolyticus]|uniref:Folate-binding Fe/S cluster repair protein n=1 Tax=Acinetobacter haemolyticus TaxID=29430 RepID=A0A4P7B2I7_ACIHA|nr:folate-binding Fe/S cluster repair protein [Acinetobacter haemolyticus]NAR28828.1 folate-binding Fe/S cluster repair protein [Acinetobacter haemolyticus]NAR63358.1 folate-binding Fe/S cluster repair protein [Acinetobacter haemolyticus]NAR72059.1 folate-binding Fe/S cluster repair protein [Acinetobacter haemolyticus]NAR76660.1 folate-binding Fe/S cluster repair protein [Acinetobacter haemolyticus]NAR78222.1 folate-binding Fe/S cluster repair protein [Acinetobacter haemolyticus]